MDQNSNASAFLAYASSANLTPDETYSIELLIERHLINSDTFNWEEWTSHR